MTQAEKKVTNQKQVLRAAAIVAGAFIVGRLLGLVREIVIRSFFGIGSTEAIAYAYANRFPDTLFNVIAGGALASAFIPTFAAYFAKDDEEGAWNLFSAVINLIVLILTALAALTAFFAEPLLLGLYVSAEDLVQRPEVVPLAVQMMRIMLLSTVVFGASGVLMGTLNARQRFLAPALAASLYNVGIIIGTVAWAPSALGLAYGTVIGATAHLLIQLPSLRQVKARYRPLLTLSSPGVRRVLLLMAPRVIGLSFSYLNRFIMPILTRPLVVGSLPALDNAFQVTLMPYSILGQAMGVAAFPTLSALVAEEKWDELKSLFIDAVRSICFLGFPVTAGLILLRRPLIQLLFERGEFDAQATTFVAAALSFYALALTALALLEVVTRTFYAMGDTVTPVIASVLQLPLMAAIGSWLAYIVFPRFGLLPLGGFALGFSISNWIELLLLLFLLQRRLKGVIGRTLLDVVGRILTATGVMSIAVWAALQLSLPLLLLLGMATLIGGLVFGAAAWILQIPEIKRFFNLVWARINRDKRQETRE